VTAPETRTGTAVPWRYQQRQRRRTSSGALPNGLEREVAESIQDLPPETDSWIDALLDYADARREDRGPREGWAELTRDEPEQAAPSPQEQAQEAATD